MALLLLSGYLLVRWNIDFVCLQLKDRVLYFPIFKDEYKLTVLNVHFKHAKFQSGSNSEVAEIPKSI